MDWRRAVVVGLFALTLLCLAWELWLAPLRPGGSMLVWKALPLAIALGYAKRGERRTFQWLPMLILFYFTEGVVRAWSETGMSRVLASIEIALSLWVYVGSIAASRAGRPVIRANTAHSDQDAAS